MTSLNNPGVPHEVSKGSRAFASDLQCYDLSPGEFIIRRLMRLFSATAACRRGLSASHCGAIKHVKGHVAELQLYKSQAMTSNPVTMPV